MRALPYGMRRVKVLAMAAGERDLVNRMRVWFGGISVKEREAIMGREASSDAAGPLSIFVEAFELAANLCSSIKPPGFPTISWSVATA